MILQAAGAAAGQNAAGGSSLSFLLMLALMFLVMWLFMIRPQRKQQKELVTRSLPPAVSTAPSRMSTTAPS